jgi:hypothetical protein
MRIVGHDSGKVYQRLLGRSHHVAVIIGDWRHGHE